MSITGILPVSLDLVSRGETPLGLMGKMPMLRRQSVFIHVVSEYVILS
jgi:hypothetical protein